MNHFIPILKQTRLFTGMDEEPIEDMVSCLNANFHKYRKNEYVYHSGTHIHSVSILTKGSLFIQKDDYWGNRSILQDITEGEIFGEAYAMPGSEPLIYDVVAREDSSILSFSMSRLLTTCPNACMFHTQIIQNLVCSLSARNRTLTQKIDYMAQRSIREKLIAYLSAQSKKSGKSAFDIPFNRQQLADFLCVDRSAMSHELSKMQDDGMLSFYRNHFELIH